MVAVLGFAFVKGYDHFAPRTHFTPAELVIQQQIAKEHPGASNDPTSANESSTSEHLASLREGVRTVVHHPWGFGLGNAGVTAVRTHVAGRRASRPTPSSASRSVSSVRSSSWRGRSCSLSRVLTRRPWLGAAFAAVLVLGLQTDVIGVPWIAVAVWALVGLVSPGG